MATPNAAKHRDLEQRFRNVEQRLRELASAALRRPKFEVSAGDLTINGGDLVVDGGDFLLLDTDGSTVLQLGPQTHGDRGVSIYRETGEVALAVRKIFGTETETQSLVLTDRNGNTIVAEEAIGDGLARPWLAIPMQPVLAASGAVQSGPWGWEVPTTSASFVSVHQGWYARHNQFASFRLRIKASDTTTAGEVRVINANTSDVLGEFLAGPWTGTRAAGSTGYTEVVTPTTGLFLPGDPWQSISLAVQVRRTAGAGTLTVALPEARGGTGL